jgi:hypothetical protein
MGLLSSRGGPQLPCDGRSVAATMDLQAHTVTWTCVGCLLPKSSERAIGMSEDVKVAEGVTPSWTLYADFGN